MKQINTILLLVLTLIAGACSKDEKEPFDVPYVHIMTDTGLSRVVVKSEVNNINTYKVYVSTVPLTTNLEVNYQVIVGDGLKQGVDFELVTKGSMLTFLPGIYDMPIRVRWIPHQVDETKDNTLTIRLSGNNQGIHLGMPGPDGLQRELVIEKQN